MHLEPLDVARLFVGTSVLAFASYTDWRWRRAPDALWWVAGGAGALMLAAGALLDPLFWSLWPYLLLAGVFAAMMYAFWWLGLIAGGADAKALMALALLVPFPLHLGALPLLPSPLPPPFGLLGNALVVSLLVPLGLLAANLARGQRSLPRALLGLRMPVEQARRRHVWPMERVEEGRVVASWMPARHRWTEEDWDALAAVRREVWVTPKVPFMLPLLAGFVALFVLGDALSALMPRL